jgi:hypothetical protein
MPKQNLTYGMGEIEVLLADLLKSQGKKVIGSPKWNITAASSDGPLYSPGGVSLSFDVEDIPRPPVVLRYDPLDYSSCKSCGGRGEGACRVCGYPGTPGDR